ncbi:DUF1684 domain-containing protein [Zeaxanthinibacter sp. PT1]|uniref:DUF1684 domain-containing protein n=1 Tax=Zeaxanthinibacter TaxID=561554 RepID=UPI00234A3FBC|nr:DUF1684 domain-containing protein [Zeaxanthinibacter sp. PT1]MDC6352470.1 DUF1684 domain-containing protein [Zeaxanthinibacter sp. PT1]
MFRTVLHFIIILLISVSCRDAKKYHDTPAVTPETAETPEEEILLFQQEMNRQFRDPESSPLPDRYRADFEGLDFYEPDTNFRVVARLERTPEALPFSMPTTTDRLALEVVYGVAYFELQGETYQLEVYQEAGSADEADTSYLFLPFTDLTNGEETYSGGRYLDLDIPDGDSLLIDFNRAYNPYCVYNKKYSCPIVPKVNHLATAVRAGLKDFDPKK